MGAMSFTIEKRVPRSGARAGAIKTPHGVIHTPAFAPVGTKAGVKGILPDELKKLGAEVVLANTYHLYLQPGEKIVRDAGGLGKFMNWRGSTITDSGGFQVFSLANVRKITEEGVTFKDPKSGREVLITPEKSMQIQSDLGADIIMAFDDLTGLDPAKTKVRTDEAVERTHRWLVRCIAEFKKLTKNLPETERPLLFGIAQGGLDKKLRAKSLEFVQSQEVDGLGIGGLSVGESKNDMHGMLKFLGKLYDPTKIRYLMGVGEPSNMRYAIEHGIDMFDCVLPTRNARHGSLWITGDKRLNLNNARHAADPGPIDNKCDCSTCKMGYSRAYLYQLFKTDNPLGGSLASTHNLRYLARLCEEYQ